MSLRINHILVLAVNITAFTAYSDAEIVKILIQGDTQKIMDANNGKQDNFVPLMAKLLTDPVTRDADFILQMGDIVESDSDNSDRPQQYAIAREGWYQVNDSIPYVLNIGNNDDAEEYFEAFNYLPNPFSETPNRQNFAYLLNAGGIDWLVISMRYWHSNVEQATRDDEFKWAKALIEANQDKQVIFVKHEVTANSGIVNRLKRYPNVSLILSGHTQSQYEILTGENGNKIGWIRTCHHDATLDPYFRILLIDTVRGTVSSSFYSPQYEKFWHDPTAPYHDCIKSAVWAYTGFDFGLTSLVAPEVPSKDAKIIELETPCAVVAESNFSVRAKVLNTGTEAWDATLPTKKYKLGSENPRDNRDWGQNTIRTNLSENLLPGDTHVFEINCIAPTEPGFYNFRRRMLKESEGWFGDYSENRIIHVIQNIVKAGFFENNNGSVDLSLHWSLGNGASWTDLEQKNGSLSLQLSGASTSTRQVIQLEKDTDYDLSFWAKRANLKDLPAEEVESDNAFLDIYDTINKSSLIRIEVANGSTSEGWTQFAANFNSGFSDAPKLRIYGSSLKSTVWFDDIVLKPSDSSAYRSASGPAQTAYKDIEFSHAIDVTDFDFDSLSYQLISKPGWLSFNEGTAVLSGTPDINDIGTHAVTFYIADGQREKRIAFTINVLETSPFAHWSELHQTSSITSDDDQDGIVSLLEFAFGGNPNEQDLANFPVFSKGDSGFDFKFRRNQSTLVYKIKESTDLIDWADYILIDDGDTFVGDTCILNFPGVDKKQFFKLEVSQQTVPKS